MNIYQVNQVPIKSILDHFGEGYIKAGKEYRWDLHTSCTFHDHIWYQHSQNRGGMAVQFLTTFYEYTKETAIEFLQKEFEIPLLHNSYNKTEILIESPHNDNRKAISFLRDYRFIQPEVIQAFIDLGLIYEDQKYHNVNFVGFDEFSQIQHIAKHSTFPFETTFKGNAIGSVSDYSFHFIGDSQDLYIFESPIDLLSYITLNSKDWMNHSYVALCGLTSSPIHYLLEQHPWINQLILCLDNDPAGDDALDRIKEEFSALKIVIKLSKYKDFNEDLKSLHNQSALPAIKNPYKLARETIKSQILTCINNEKAKSFKDLMNNFSFYLYVQDYTSQKQKEKATTALVKCCVDCLLLIQQQNKHLEIQTNDISLLSELDERNIYSVRPQMLSSCKDCLLFYLNELKAKFLKNMYHSTSDKIDIIHILFQFTNLCINTIILIKGEQ